MVIFIILACLGYILIGTVIAGLEIKRKGMFYTDLSAGTYNEKAKRELVTIFAFVWPIFITIYILYFILKPVVRLLTKLANKIAGE